MRLQATLPRTAKGNGGLLLPILFIIGGSNLFAVDVDAKALILFINSYRLKEGFDTLIESPAMNKMATAYSLEMFNQQTISHYLLSNDAFKDLCYSVKLPSEIKDFHELLTIAKDAQEALQNFQGSPRHNKGLLLPDGYYIGAACHKNYYCIYIGVLK